MSQIEIIKAILCDKNLKTDYPFLIEENLDTSKKQFTTKYRIVSDSSIEFLLYRFIDNDFPFFSDIKKLKKMCDYIIFAEKSNKLSVFLIELKKNSDSARKQLEAAEEFVKFIINSGVRLSFKFYDFEIKKIRIVDSQIKRRSPLDPSQKYEFDNNNYLNYTCSNSFLLKMLM